MNFLFLGGSNTLMQKGYVYHFQSLYETFIDEEIYIKNIAVGANSCVHGLELIKSEDDLAKYDCVIVEYIVNDYKLASTDRIQSWRQVYEGLLRYLIKNCSPGTRIINLVLGRRDQNAFARQKKLAKEIYGFVERYSQYGNVEMLDATKALMRIAENKVDVYASLYRDDAHYSVPFGSSLVGSLLLNHYLGKVPNRTGFPLLPNDSLGYLEDSVVLSATRFGDTHRRFKNSRIELSALVISANSTVELEIPGSLIGFSYISTFDCLSVLVEEEGEEPFFIDGRHQWALADQSRFMLKNLPLTWKQWGHAFEKSRKIRFTAISQEKRATVTARYIKQNNVKEPNSASLDGACFYLVSLLTMDR